MKNKVNLLEKAMLSIFQFFLANSICFYFYDFLEKRKFFIDAQTLYYRILSDHFTFKIADSFTNSALIYKILLPDKITFEETFIFTSIMYFLVLLFICLVIKVNQNKTVYYVFFSVYIIHYIFFFQLTKDFFSLIYNIMILYILKKNKKWLLVFISIIFSLTIRRYYILITLVYLYLNYFFKNKKMKKINIIIIVILSLLYYFTNFLNPIINVRLTIDKRLIESANTIILYNIPMYLGEKNLIKYLVNTSIIFVRLLFPIEVVFRSFISGLSYIPFQIFITYILYTNKVLFRRIKNNKLSKFSRVYKYLISVYIVSALFEPDFGSFLDIL